MARTLGPLMSLDASGSVGKIITFSKWKGRNYVRRLVKPSQPRSGPQVGRRAMMKFLAQSWVDVAGADQATWQDLADQLVASPFNAYVSDNMKGWHNFLPPSEASPPTRVGTPSDSALTDATWEENRIKIEYLGAAPGDAWGLIIFAYLSTGLDLTVANTILVVEDLCDVSLPVYWTPPEVTTWWFDSIPFTDDGKKGPVGGEVSAVPA